MSFVSGFLQLAWCFHGSSIIACISTSLLFTALSGFGILLLYVLDISKVLTPCKYIAAPGKFKSRASLDFAVFKRPYLKSMGLQRVRQDLATKQQQWYLWRTRRPSRERIHLQCSRHRRCRFNPWARKIPWRILATHSSILAWRIPWTEEPGGLVHGVTKSQTQLGD